MNLRSGESNFSQKVKTFWLLYVHVFCCCCFKTKLSQVLMPPRVERSESKKWKMPTGRTGPKPNSADPPGTLPPWSCPGTGCVSETAVSLQNQDPLQHKHVALRSCKWFPPQCLPDQNTSESDREDAINNPARMAGGAGTWDRHPICHVSLSPAIFRLLFLRCPDV